MPNFRRWRVPGAAYFFTVVTHQRRPILTTDRARNVLRNALEAERERAPFDLFAIVLLPDHLHTIWTLLPGDADYSTRWARIKAQFTRDYLAAGGTEGETTGNRARHRERAVWQHRFWEHTIRDEVDWERCTNYVHANPVKHGLARRAADYPYSSFHRFVKRGDYAPEWGTGASDDVPGAEWE